MTTEETVAPLKAIISRMDDPLPHGSHSLFMPRGGATGG